MKWNQEQGREGSLDWRDLSMFEAMDSKCAEREQLFDHKGEGGCKVSVR